MGDSTRGSNREALAIGGFGFAMGLCCALPLLLAGGALGGAGALLGNPWLIAAAVALVAGVVLWRVRRTNQQSGSSCCPPEPHAHVDSRHSDPGQATSRDTER